MLKITLENKKALNPKVLCLGAHCDDIEIGCGGTIMNLIDGYQNIEFYLVVFCSTREREEESYKSFEIFLKKVQKKSIDIFNFKDGFLPYQTDKVKYVFEKMKKTFVPDLVLTHYRDDRHQDHRTVSDLTWNTYRDHLILEYEIPKYDGDFGTPNFFVELSEATCRQKIDNILHAYTSQRDKHWFTEDIFLATARLRGMESCAKSKYAEAFYCRKIVL
jgi:LmbE family N-acetylglucosaminyl deacetylase